MLFAKGLCVSLPARELVDAKPEGALLDAEAVLSQRLSGGLRAAVLVLQDHVQTMERRLVFLRRSEMFTHGDALAWLDARLGGIEDHLSLSDGTVIHLLPGRRNHLFFYMSGEAEARAALRRFVARAPELTPQLVTQINTNLAFGKGKAKHAPRPMLLQTSSPGFAGMAAFREFYFNDCGIEDSVNRSELAGDLPPEALAPFAAITYIPFTGQACVDPAFNLYVGQRIRAALRQPEHLLLLGLPPAVGKEDTVRRMLFRLLAGLQAHGGMLPRAVLSNVMIATARVDPADLPNAQLKLVLPESFEFWRLPRASYGRFSRIAVAMPRQRAVTSQWSGMLDAALGVRPEIEWLDPPPGLIRAGEDDDD